MTTDAETKLLTRSKWHEEATSDVAAVDRCHGPGTIQAFRLVYANCPCVHTVDAALGRENRQSQPLLLLPVNSDQYIRRVQTK